MRILIDTSFAARGPSGTAVYLERLIAALRANGSVEVVEAARPPRRSGRDGGSRNPLRSMLNLLAEIVWLHVRLPRAARRARADVLHHPLPARSLRAPCPEVVTVHDVAYERLPERFDRGWRTLARRRHRAAVRHAAIVVCVSEAAARDAVELLGAEAARVIVARHGPGQELPKVERSPAPAHLLYVGDDEPRKNLARLLDAYAGYRGRAEQPYDLVLAGDAAGRAGAPGVRGVPAPGPAELAGLLASAAALVHPSLEEGFGLTLLEAMAAGAPVVAVRNRATEEVCADAALLVDGDGLEEALAHVARDADLRARLSAAGRERARAFNWADSARTHERAYGLAAVGARPDGALATLAGEVERP